MGKGDSCIKPDLREVINVKLINIIYLINLIIYENALLNQKWIFQTSMSLTRASKKS